MDLEGESRITMDEALPMVCLTERTRDKRVFGVVGLVDGDTSAFHLGSFTFVRRSSHTRRLVVHSAGEGAICVCNANGPIENGDYLESAGPLWPGYAMQQGDDVARNYTVVKATCDCLFTHGSTEVIGCVYCT